MFYALTINNKLLTDKLKTIDSVFKLLNVYCSKVNYISVERNELNENIHYHVLCEDFIDVFEDDEYIWHKPIEYSDEVIKYIDYLKKDGKYKVFNIPNLVFENAKWYDKAYSLIKSKDSLLEVFESDLSLLKYYNQISRLWELYHINPSHKFLINNL